MSRPASGRRWTPELLLLSWIVAIFTPLASQAGSEEVKLTLPVRARLDLSGRSTITIAPFLVVTEEEGSIERRRLDVQDEFEDYL